MTLFPYDPNRIYEVDCEPFDIAHYCHGFLMEASSVGWLVLSGHSTPKIVVSQRSVWGIAMVSLAVLDERMRDGLRSVRDLTDELLGKLSRVQGADRDQFEGGVVVLGKLLDMWHPALATCVAPQDRVIQASLSVTETLRSAVRERDLRNPVEFWGLFHQLSLDVQTTIGVCREPRVGDGASAADGPVADRTSAA